MNTVTRNGQVYLVVEGEKLVNGAMVKRDFIMWIGTEKILPKVEPKPESERVLGRLLKDELLVQS